MGITVIPDLLTKPVSFSAEPEKPKVLGDVADYGKYYRHPDSALISYPLVVKEPLGSEKKPLGSIDKPLKIAIVGSGVAGTAALYELSRLRNSNIKFTIYESDPDNFIHNQEQDFSLTVKGLKAGRVSAALSSDQPGIGGIDQTVYEIGAMRFPEIAGLMWHYARTLYGNDKEMKEFPNPGTVPTEMVHGDRVDRFCKGVWLDSNSPTKKVVEIVKSRLFGSKKEPDTKVDPDNKIHPDTEIDPDTSLFPIGGRDPAKLSYLLKQSSTDDTQLAHIYQQWKDFVKEHDGRTLESAIREVIEKSISQLPDIDGLLDDAEKINHYVELFGTVGFGTGGFKPLYNISLIEMMRLLLWNYSKEYLLPTEANVYFIQKLYQEASNNNSNVDVKLARVCDVGHLDKNSEGAAIVVSYTISPYSKKENPKPKVGIYDYVILTSTPRQTSSMISKIGFKNGKNEGRRVTLGDYDRPLNPEDYEGEVRPALILSDKSETANSKLFTALNNIHMVSSSKIFAKIKKSDFDKYAPDLKGQGKIHAVVSDRGLGSSYVVPSTILDRSKAAYPQYQDYYSFLISYGWEDVTKRLQHHFGKYPSNKDDTELMMKTVINSTIREVKDPEKGNALGRWWFGEALSKNKLEDPLSYDWTTYHSSGAFKLDSTGEHSNSNLLFRYHTHALKPELKNRFFLANDSYTHLGGWIEGAFMSAVNAVCGLIVAANDGDVNALSKEARKVVESFDNVVEKDY